LQVIESFDEKQVGDLLHHFQGIRNASCPERIPYLVDFGLNFAGDQFCSPMGFLFGFPLSRCFWLGDDGKKPVLVDFFE
jgi:hypothetical protein